MNNPYNWLVVARRPNQTEAIQHRYMTKEEAEKKVEALKKRNNPHIRLYVVEASDYNPMDPSRNK